MIKIPKSRDKVLFTPGPLTTSSMIKQSMLKDLASRDTVFIRIIREIREKLIAIGNVSEENFTAIPMQGSGTFGVEAVISSTIPRDGKLLVIANGAYGERMIKMAEILGIEYVAIRSPENQIPSLEKIDLVLERNRFSNVAVVHCETTTGLINPIREIGGLIRKNGDAKFFVDAMSSFGAMPIEIEKCQIDYLVSSANKCIEGVPGFSFVLARKSALIETEGFSRTLSFDLFGQWRGLEKNGQFRFTPPTHAMIAFHQALIELEIEGGVLGRADRYRKNYELLISEMIEIGFEAYLKSEDRGYIITSFLSPKDPNFDFEIFYQKLSDRGFLIYPGKVSNADCFRIGTVGRIFESDIRSLTAAIRSVLNEMKIQL